MIVIGCPLRNRQWILHEYLDAIYNLDYPKKEIVLCFLINDSIDGSFNIISTFFNRNRDKYADIVFSNLEYGADSCDRELGRTLEKFEHFALIRNKWVDLFKDVKKVSHVFSVDSDVIVSKDALKKLLSNNKDICSLLVNNSTKERGYGKDITNLFKYNEQYSQYENVRIYSKSDIFEVDVTGAAYLIKRKVLDDVEYKAHVLGEDFGFCLCAKELGYKVWCDTTLKAKHYMKKGGKK